MKQLHCITLVAVMLACTSASAQWMWLDKDGRKVFSDRAPPANIPDKDVFKRPDASARLSPEVPEVKPANDAMSQPSAKGDGKRSTDADREFLARKKQAAEAESEHAKDIRAQNDKIKADNCASARQALMDFTAGGRITRTNAKGEREYLSDAQIASERQRAQEAVNSSCQ